MHIKSAEFIKSAASLAGCPPPGLPEIAFAGRSNVGKSSLINVLVERKGLVRTSRTPGRTQLLNFFNINNQLTLVDLPGYGFAQVPIAVKKAWGPMVRNFLERRASLRAVVVLFDIRRVPREEDIQLLDWLEEFAIPTIPVITKSDKISRNQRAAQLKPIAAATGLEIQDFTLFSALNKEGRAEIWERIGDALALPPTRVAEPLDEDSESPEEGAGAP